MRHFNFLSNFRWFTTVILLITLGIGQMWGADPTVSADFQCSCSQAGTTPNTFTASGGETNSGYYKLKTGSIISDQSYDVDPSQSISVTMYLGTYGGYTSGKNDVTFYLVNSSGTQISSAYTSNFTSAYTSSGGKKFTGSVTLNKGQDGKGVKFKFVSSATATSSVYARFHTLSVTYKVPTYNVYVINTGCTGGSYSSNKGTSGSGTGTYSSCTRYSGITAGTSVTITATPSSGYQFDGWEYSSSSIIEDTSGNEITPSSTTSTTATFTMPSKDVVIWTCNFSVACANSVTINKGASTNCSFSLSKSGAQASCDGVATTVSITPNTGYGTPVVTQSGASATPTISGSGNTQTVTYAANTTGTSAISVSCSANNYTISLDNESATTSGTANITATYNDDNNLDGTPAITVPAKTGWTFGGYYTAKQGGGTQIIAANGNVNASAGGGSTYTDASKNWKYADAITLYAKWTCTVTWSVNRATNVYSTQTVTYNSSGCKVASVPSGSDLDLENDYCGDKFMGWTSDENYVHGTSNLFTNVAGSPNITGDVTFYAVFADYAD